VDHDLLAIGAGRFQHVMRQETFGHAGEGVGTACAKGHDPRGRSSGNVFVDGQSSTWEAVPCSAMESR
jgi:hypothetical protein